LLAMSFGAGMPRAQVTFHAAFGAQG